MQETEWFGLQAMFEGSIGVSVPFTLYLSCGIWSKLAYDNSVKLVCCSRWIPLLTLYENYILVFMLILLFIQPLEYFPGIPYVEFF